MAFFLASLEVKTEIPLGKKLYFKQDFFLNISISNSFLSVYYIPDFPDQPSPASWILVPVEEEPICPELLLELLVSF